jgi:F0F1-type ATP synthase membrane subunit b/b'
MDIFFLLLTIEEKSGGLFDFDGTLPLTIFEFLVLMFILEKILYKPLSNITTIRIKNLKEKNERAELLLSTNNFLTNLYNTEISNIEKKIDIILKQDDIVLKNIFQNRLFELSQNSIKTIMDKEQDINKKIANLSSNFKIKNTSFYLAAIIIDLIICN